MLQVSANELILRPHPQSVVPDPLTLNAVVTIGRVEAKASAVVPTRVQCEFIYQGPELCWPMPLSGRPARADGLWKTTCFELFLNPIPGRAYWEINASPSGDFAVYAFDDYRSGGRNETRVPQVEIHSSRALTSQGCERITLVAGFEIDEIPHLAQADAWRFGVTAVLEFASRPGDVCYMALAHPRAKPDFHDHDGFELRLENPKGRER